MAPSNPPDDGLRLPTYTIRSLEQLKILSDPLRMRILEAFIRTPGTTKQVAKSLGEPPTKLYHHVDALERAGLIELRSTRQNRGTLEKHYGAIAEAFRVDPDLLPGELDPSTTLGLGTEILQRTADDFRQLEERISADSDLWQSQGAKSLVTMLEVYANDEEVEELHGHIETFLGSLAEESRARFPAENMEEAITGRERYRFVVAFHPLPPVEGDEADQSASDEVEAASDEEQE